MEPTIYKPGAYNTPGIYKGAGGVYNGRGVYNEWAGSDITEIDIDGKIYQVVKIGYQLWITENLDLSTSNSRYYNNNQNYFNPLKGGRLYPSSDFPEIESKLSNGWKIPSYSDWDKLINFVGGVSVAGKKLKSTQYNGENFLGFNLVCAGNQNISNSSFWDGGNIGFYWTSTFWDAARDFYYRAVLKNQDNITENESMAGFRRSVRLCKNI